MVSALLATAIVLGVTSAMLTFMGAAPGILLGLLAEAAYPIAMLGALVFLFRKKNIKLSPMLRRRSRELREVSLVVPLILFSVSSMWLIVFGLDLISEGAGQAYEVFMDRMAPPLIPPDAVPAVYHYLVLLVTIAILVPVVEELIFRAVLIERLGRRFGFKLAVILSAVLFGIVHPSDVLGATVFGIVTGLLYLKTLSLFLPILIHMINNGLMVFMIALDEQFLDGAFWESLQQLGRQVWLALAIFLGSSFWVLRFIRQNWSLVSTRKPMAQS
ncbi:MAG: CPBP family intramembrane glutamic endopeptidase [Wenzhouxiangella sp.]